MTDEDWEDAWDARSQILLARDSSGRLCGSIRVTFNGPIDPWEYSPYADRLAAEERLHYAESSRLCTDPDVADHRLSAWLGAWKCVLAWRMGKSKLIACCGQGLLKFWGKYGYRSTGIKLEANHRRRLEDKYLIVVDLGLNPPVNPHCSPSLQKFVSYCWELSETLEFPNPSPLLAREVD